VDLRGGIGEADGASAAFWPPRGVGGPEAAGGGLADGRLGGRM